MKKLKKITLAIVFVMSIVGFVSCGEKDDVHPNDTLTDTNASAPGNTPDPSIDTTTPAPLPAPDGWVDLGLPSGLLWAECNVGATSPEDTGYYFAWGETTTKSTYSWETYCYCTVHPAVDHPIFNKYCNQSRWGMCSNPTLSVLEASDDAATVLIGDGAHTPRKRDWEELKNNTTSRRTTMNGVNGLLLTAPNGNSIFLPAAGHRYNNSLNGQGNSGYYWTSQYNDVQSENHPDQARAFVFYYEAPQINNYYRCCGLSVRAVRAR